MPFKNYLVAGTTLKREAIQSPNYVTGTSGWTIRRDGSAEFNDALFRGTLQIGVPPAPYLLISGTVPPALSAFYGGTWAGVVAAFSITMAIDANNYHYEVLLSSSSVGMAHAEGFVVAGVVRETVLHYVSGGSTVSAYGEFTDSEVTMFGTNLLGDPSTPGSDMLWGSHSLSRGVVDSGIVAGNPIVVATGGGAEVQINHSLVNAFEPNRAYRCQWNITFSASAAAGAAQFKMRRGVGIAGARVWQRSWPISATGLTDILISQVCITDATPPTQAVSMCVQASAGSNITVFGTGGFQTQFEIMDISDAVWYIGYPAL